MRKNDQITLEFLILHSYIYSIHTDLSHYSPLGCNIMQSTGKIEEVDKIKAEYKTKIEF